MLICVAPTFGTVVVVGATDVGGAEVAVVLEAGVLAWLVGLPEPPHAPTTSASVRARTDGNSQRSSRPVAFPAARLARRCGTRPRRTAFTSPSPRTALYRAERSFITDLQPCTVCR